MDIEKFFSLTYRLAKLFECPSYLLVAFTIFLWSALKHFHQTSVASMSWVIDELIRLEMKSERTRAQ